MCFSIGHPPKMDKPETMITRSIALHLHSHRELRRDILANIAELPLDGALAMHRLLRLVRHIAGPFIRIYTDL